VDTETVRARQTRPRRTKRPSRITAAQVKRTRALEDNPPPTFSDLSDFRTRWQEWSPRDEADYVRWVFMDTGMTYDEADAEVRAVTTLLHPQPLTAWQGTVSGAREPGAPDARREAA
jgi:hypothetical protein